MMHALLQHATYDEVYVRRTSTLQHLLRHLLERNDFR